MGGSCCNCRHYRHVCWLAADRRCIVISIKTVGFQQAADALAQALKEFRGEKFVTVGIHEGEGSKNVEDGTITQATNGAIQEFGTADGHIPARPWLVPGVQSATRDIIEAIASGISAGQTPDETLEQVGLVAVGAVQEYMTDLQTPPNAPSTVRKKGSNNPLIDSGAMRASVTHAVTSEQLEEGL